MSTQSFEPLQINSPVESTITNSNSIYSTDLDVTDVVTINNRKNLKKINLIDNTDVGWLNFQPKFLNYFMNARWALFWLCWGGALQGLLVNGFINVVITTIERRFGLRSSQTGLVASAYDIASFICLAPITYFGGRMHASKPKWIAWGVVIMGMGSFVFALPHFIFGQYRAVNTELDICSTGNSTMEGCSYSSLSSNGLQSTTENLSWSVWLFFLAQILNGIGASPLFTLGVTYIDENVSKKMSSVYLGIYYTMAIIGPAVGFVMGGQLLQIYTDIFTVDPNTLGLTPQSKVWVGAWWIPFIFTGILCILLAIPMAAYPRKLPGAENIEKVSEAHGKSVTNENFTKLKEMPKAFFQLMKNPTFCFLNFAGATEGMTIAGFAAFLPKFIENQFSVNAVWAAVLMGIVTVPAGGGGTFLGGYLVKKFNLSCAGIIKLCFLATFFAILFTFSFFLSCPNSTFAGVTSSYFPNSHSAQTSIVLNQFKTEHSTSKNYNLESSCNSKCKCSKSNYDPICGKDGVMYYSPCHAGCTKEVSLEKTKVYYDCSCIETNNYLNNSTKKNYDAVNIFCETECTNLWKFTLLCSFLMFFTFIASMPALSATLRCVQEEQRSFALGIQWIKVRIFGTIPAPMIFGFLIDASCILWQETCDDSGACLVYDNKYMSRYMMAVAFIGKTCSLLFFFGAWFFYVPPKSVPDTEKKEPYNGHINLGITEEKY